MNSSSSYYWTLILDVLSAVVVVAAAVVVVFVVVVVVDRGTALISVSTSTPLRSSMGRTLVLGQMKPSHGGKSKRPLHPLK